MLKVKISKCGQSAGKVPFYYGYICGFTDGEGSFNISFKIRDDYTFGVKVTASFNISQKEKEILLFIQDIFQCGTIRHRGDGVYYFEVTNIDDLINIVIPFFDKYQLLTRKREVFKIFKEMVSLMKIGEHKTPEGILKIYDIREKIKVGRKRKYSKADVRRQIERRKILRDYTPNTKNKN